MMHLGRNNMECEDLRVSRAKYVGNYKFLEGLLTD